MIITPRCQIALRFENSLNDRGNFGSNWSLTNFPGYQDGKIGRGTQNFVGNAYIHTSNIDNITTEVTVALWYFWGNSTGSQGAIAGQEWLQSGNGFGFFQLPRNGTPAINWAVRPNNNNTSQWIELSPTNSWHHIVGTAKRLEDGTTWVQRFYFDGELIEEDIEVKGVGSTLLRTLNRPFSVGARNAGPWGFYDSNAYDELYVWNKALEGGDIERIMNGLHPLNG